MNRRDFIYTGTLGPLLLPQALKAQDNKEEPHFLFHYNMSGGLDKTYTFDSRPLEMMQEKIQLNYLSDQPDMVKTDTGGVAYFSKLVDPLLKYKSHFSILNGVMMSPAFDGHIENTSQIMSGEALGGPFYMPDLNLGSKRSPIDYLQMGPGLLLGNLTNMGGGVNFSLTAAHNLVDKVSRIHSLDTQPKLANFLQRSFTPGMDAKGGFEKSRLLMGQAHKRGLSLAKMLSGVELPELPSVETDQENPTAPNTIRSDIEMAIGLFKSGMSRAVIYNPESNGQDRFLDAHDNQTARNSPTIVASYIDDMVQVFKILSETAYDDQRSMLDVTTVLITTEISRTMRSMFRDEFEEGGTDHNQLANTVLIGGAKVKGGMLIGSSDCQSVEEYRGGTTKAHLAKDPDKKKTMGRPFDLQKFVERTDKPETFLEEDYLSINSVLNTVYSAFSIPKERWRERGRSGLAYEPITQLLT